MKTENKLYIILSYIFFIFPPFIWGLVEIYSDRYNDSPHITSLIINIAIYILLVLVIGSLINRRKLNVPDKTEQKHLLFGFIGNLTIYFYTFQNFMRIDDFITIYLVLIIVLAVYYLLFNRKFKPLELWILAPTFLIIDTIHLLYTGCGFTEGYSCVILRNPDWFTYTLYSLIIVVSLVYYIVKIVKLRPYSILKYINIGLVITISLIVQNIDNANSKLLGTLFISLPFFIIIDFIVSIVNKTYQSKTVIFYIRTSTILGIMFFLGTTEFFKGEANYNILSIMVVITYVSLTVNILSHLLHVEVAKKIVQQTKMKFIPSNEQEEYMQTFEELHSINDNELLFVTTTNNIVSTYLIVTLLDISSFKEAQLSSENVEALINHLDYIESYLRSLNVYQIKIVLNQESEELLVNKYSYICDKKNSVYLKTL